ncbi:MAG: DUF11 domain-containing protein, partial [bacterium]|nr:DUF11 domain-containing protein [bacterium]
PGECIQYRIIATNNAAADVDSVVITDATPTNTTYNTAAGAATVTQGAVTAPVAGATGTVQATVGTITPGASVTLTFAVRIDP